MKKVKIILIPRNKVSLYETQESIKQMLNINNHEHRLGVIEGEIENFKINKRVTVNKKADQSFKYTTTIIVDTGLKFITDTFNKDISCIILCEDDTVLASIDSITISPKEDNLFNTVLICNNSSNDYQIKKIIVPGSFHSILTTETFDKAINSVIKKYENKL